MRSPRVFDQRDWPAGMLQRFIGAWNDELSTTALAERFGLANTSVVNALATRLRQAGHPVRVRLTGTGRKRSQPGTRVVRSGSYWPWVSGIVLALVLGGAGEAGADGGWIMWTDVENTHASMADAYDTRAQCVADLDEVERKVKIHFRDDPTYRRMSGEFWTNRDSATRLMARFGHVNEYWFCLPGSVNPNKPGQP